MTNKSNLHPSSGAKSGTAVMKGGEAMTHIHRKYGTDTDTHFTGEHTTEVYTRTHRGEK